MLVVCLESDQHDGTEHDRTCSEGEHREAVPGKNSIKLYSVCTSLNIFVTSKKDNGPTEAYRLGADSSHKQAWPVHCHSGLLNVSCW